jgi:hypothetical protein
MSYRRNPEEIPERVRQEAEFHEGITGLKASIWRITKEMQTGSLKGMTLDDYTVRVAGEPSLEIGKSYGGRDTGGKYKVLSVVKVRNNPRPAKRKNPRTRRNPDDFTSIADDLTVGQTILKQMGGRNRLVGMIGAKDFISYPNGVAFKFMDPGAGKPNYVKITLNFRDTYDVEFGRLRGMNYKVIESFSDVYNNSLRSLFEKTTGLYLSL